MGISCGKKPVQSNSGLNQPWLNGLKMNPLFFPMLSTDLASFSPNHVDSNPQIPRLYYYY